MQSSRPSPPRRPQAAKNLDQVLATLSANFAEGTDYLKVLVYVFQEVMLGDEQKHMKNFYMILPGQWAQRTPGMLEGRQRHAGGAGSGHAGPHARRRRPVWWASCTAQG